MDVVRFYNVFKSFEGKRVLNGLSFALEEGQTLVIVGCSGVGKSITLKHIVGLVRPDSGDVYVFGKNISYAKEKLKNQIRLRIGMVFQYGALFDFMSVYENVAFVLKQSFKLKPQYVKQRVEWALEMVGLLGIEDKMPSQLSGGMKKRVAIARAIAYDPDLMLYDEPTAGLDPIRSEMINQLILKLKSVGKTSIVVTHDLDSAYKVADRICMLFDGKFVFDGTPQEFKDSQDPVVRQFVEGRTSGPIAMDKI